MQRDINYIGADVHSKSITMSAVNSEGELMNTTTIPTSEKLLGEYLSSFKGCTHMTCEEGPLAQWMQNIVHDNVDRFIICNPIKNALIYRGNSNDVIDSRYLAELLRLNALSEVKHPYSADRQEFREIMHVWFKIQKEITRTKNRLKSVFRMKAIPCGGDTIYNHKNTEAWLAQLEGHTAAQKVAGVYWNQLRVLHTEKEAIYQEIQSYEKKFPEISLFMKVPGVGLITAATFSSFIFNPFRFENKSKLSAYCSLSLEENDTGKEIDREKEKKRRKKILKRLTQRGNKKLKAVLKSATQTACHKCKNNDLQNRFKESLARGLSYDAAILKATRSLASKLWGMWKEAEKDKKTRTKTGI